MIDNSTSELLASFLMFHVPLQSMELKRRNVKPCSKKFFKELKECSGVLSERGDTILYRTKETSASVTKLSKAIALLLLIQEEIEVFGVIFKRNEDSP